MVGHLSAVGISTAQDRGFSLHITQEGGLGSPGTPRQERPTHLDSAFEREMEAP
jgi:hypothetical protein